MKIKPSYLSLSFFTLLYYNTYPLMMIIFSVILYECMDGFTWSLCFSHFYMFTLSTHTVTFLNMADYYITLTLLTYFPPPKLIL